MRTVKMGSAFGQRVSVMFPERRSVTSIPGNPTLVWGDSMMQLDVDNMQPRLSKLIPSRFGLDGGDWRFFISVACSMGKL